MKTLSGRQPWWWAILHAGKRIENRVWNTSYRGPILLHAAKGCTVDEYEDACVWMENAGVIAHIRDVPPLAQMQRGGIVGHALIVDVIPPGGLPPSFLPTPSDLDMRWHMTEQFGFVLANVEPLPFTPCKGALGLFNVDRWQGPTFPMSDASPK
jgi:diadenosine tetraphosphatase ApaH/serine/threonine PP2A family protein phosphatase